MNKKEKTNAISNLIYSTLHYMYCDNCRFGGEIGKLDCNDESGITYGCEDCHRKYNGWGISKAESDRIAKLILDLE